MPSHAVPFHPVEYLQQGLSHCGAFAVKAILSACGKDDGRVPQKYHPSFLGRATGFSPPDTWAKLFRSRGLLAERGSAVNLSPAERLSLLKQHLDKNNVVMLRIGNGHLDSGGYSSLRGQLIGHWVTLWGYDDTLQAFYTYDPRVKRERWDRSLPAGNIARSYDATLRDWHGALFLWPWRYLYIRVQLPSQVSK